MADQGTAWETVKVQGNELVDRVKKIIEEGNVRRVVIKQRGAPIMEFPLTVGVVTAAVVPVLTIVGVAAALLSDCSIEVERVVSSRKKGTAPVNGGRKK